MLSVDFGEWGRIRHAMGDRPIRFLGEHVRSMVDSVRVSSPIVDSRQSFAWQDFAQYVIVLGPYTSIRLYEYIGDIARRMDSLSPSGHPVRNRAWAAAEGVDCARDIVEVMSVIFRLQFARPVSSRWYSVEMCAWWILSQEIYSTSPRCYRR